MIRRAANERQRSSLDEHGAGTPTRDVSDEELVARARGGDELAMNALLQRYRPFVRLRSRSYYLLGGSRDDVVQEGMIGLYRAICDYDPERGATFRSFVQLCVTGQIVRAVQKATRFKHAPLNAAVPYPADEDDPNVVGEPPAPRSDPVDTVIGKAELEVLVSFCAETLSDLESEVLQRYIDGESYEEIAASVNRHVKAVDNALQRVKRKIDRFLAERHGDVPF